MRSFACALVLLCSCVVSLAGGDAPQTSGVTVPTYLQDISVTVKSGRAQGSGALIERGGRTYVLTAGHVVEHLRRVREGNDGRGGTKKVVEFDDPQVMKIQVEDGRRIGEFNLDCEVIRYSDPEYGYDTALLRIRSRQFKTNSSTRFYLDKKIPDLGTRLYHCGSLLGEFGAGSLVDGILSQTGRVFEHQIFDQTNLNIFPGSSGGPVVIAGDGRYVGMVVRGTLGGFNFMVPIRRILDWSDRAKVRFIFDPALKVPSDEDLARTPIEEEVRVAGGTNDARR